MRHLSGWNLLRTAMPVVALLLTGQPGVVHATSPAVAVALQSTREVPSTKVGVHGTGFPRQGSGQIVWSATATVLATLRTDSNGQFSAMITVPKAKAGGYDLVIRVGSVRISKTFKVLAPIAVGAFIPGAPADPSNIDAFAAEIGRMPALIAWYQAWGSDASTIGGQFRSELLDAVTSRGATPLITWEPWVPGAGTDQPTYRLRSITRGDFDGYVWSWATGLANYGRPVYLRFAHEMNADWYPWCSGVNGNTTGDYVAAWRHLHDVFVEAGATNVRWVWSPNVEYPGATPMEALYPGNGYVDWLALDGYNYGTAVEGKGWRSFATTFTTSYNTIRQLANKPIMIAEFAATEHGGDKAAWIADAFKRQLPNKFPAIRAVVWFHKSATADWPIDTSLEAKTAFTNAMHTPYMQGRI